MSIPQHPGEWHVTELGHQPRLTNDTLIHYSLHNVTCWISLSLREFANHLELSQSSSWQFLFPTAKAVSQVPSSYFLLGMFICFMGKVSNFSWDRLAELSSMGAWPQVLSPIDYIIEVYYFSEEITKLNINRQIDFPVGSLFIKFPLILQSELLQLFSF